MSTRKLFKIIPLLLFFALPVKSNAAVNSAMLFSDSTVDAQMLSTITSRVTEIEQMDKTNLTSSEKKDLRNELRKMKQQADTLDKGRGVYLSIVGVLVIIILVLLLLL